MKKAILLLLIILGFLWGYQNYSGFPEYDSYYYLHYICNGEFLGKGTSGSIDREIFSLLPCNEQIIKSIVFTFFLIDLLALYLIGKEFTTKPDLFLLFCFLTPALLSTALRLENDTIALPFALFSIFFILLYKKNKELLALIAATGFLVPSLFIWGGSVVLIIAFILIHPLFILPTIIILWNKGLEAFVNLLPNATVNENFPLYGLLSFSFYAIIWNTYLESKITRFPKLDFPRLSIALMGYGILVPKFFVFAVPFFALTSVKIYEKIDYFQKSDKRFMVGMAILFSVAAITSFTSIGLFPAPPTQTEKMAVLELIQIGHHRGVLIGNDFELGHMVYFYGGKTGDYSGISDLIYSKKGYLVLSRRDLMCEEVKRYDNPFYGSPLRLYQC